MLFAPMLPLTMPPLTVDIFEVVSVVRSATFAGKLGSRMEDKLVLRHGERVMEVSVGPMHTLCTRPLPTYKAGDRVHLKRMRESGFQRVSPDQVHLAP